MYTRVLKEKRLVAAVAMTGIIISLPANGSLNTELAKFYNSMSGAASDTPMSVYEGQSAYYVSLGGLNARTPIRNYNLYSVRMPSVSAGCGGIDMYSGAFSFINKDEFVAMLRNIGSNAIGFAFQLALDVISPQISENIKGLMSKIENIANMNINSCEAAQKVVGGVFKALDLQSAYCRSVSVRTGAASDGAAARKLCSDEREFRARMDAERAKRTDREAQDMLKTFSGNIVWEGLKRRGLNPNNGDERALMELVMSLTGTYVIPARRDMQDSNGIPVDFKYAVGDIRFENLARPQNAHGRKARVLRCPDYDVIDCYNPVLVDADGVDSLYRQVETHVDNIVNYIRHGGSLSPAELRLIGMIKLPVFALMQAAADVSEGTLMAVARTVKDLATVELAATLIEDAVMLGYQAIAASPAAEKDEAKAMFQAHAENVLAEARAARAQAHAQFGGIHEVMRQTNYWRAQAMAKFAPNLNQRIALARALSIQLQR